MRLMALLAAVVTAAGAQPDAHYEFKGQPIRLPVACSYEQVQTLNLPCTENDPCPVFAELVDIEQVTSRLFLTGNLHTDAATIESVLLMSEDDGKTWTEASRRIEMAGLDRIQFIDFANGWISGQVQQNQPRDPFFLITRDGGKSWRRSAVYGESQPGAVEKYHFDSASNGALLIDRVQPDDNGMRHVLYETSTGGESWSIREISPKPLAWKYVESEDREVRLRADAATKSYRIEHRQGSKWELLSAFAIRAGDCRPTAPQSESAPEPEASRPGPAKAQPRFDVDQPIAPRRPPSLKKK